MGDVFSAERYIFILIGRHGNELCLGKDKGIPVSFGVTREFPRRRTRGNDMQTRHVFLHGIHHNLNRTFLVVSPSSTRDTDMSTLIGGIVGQFQFTER